MSGQLSKQLRRWTRALIAAAFLNAARNLWRTPTPTPDRMTLCGHPVVRQPFTHMEIVGQYISPTRPPKPVTSSPVGYGERLRWIARVAVTLPWKRIPAAPGGTLISDCFFNTGDGKTDATSAVQAAFDDTSNRLAYGVQHNVTEPHLSPGTRADS